MKKTLSALTAAAAALTCMTGSLTAAVAAGGDTKPKFEETYFSGGISAPPKGISFTKPMVKDNASLCWRFSNSPQNMTYVNDLDVYYENDDEETFFAELGLDPDSEPVFCYQYDMKLNDGDWLYTSEWDEISPDGGVGGLYAELDNSDPIEYLIWNYWDLDIKEPEDPVSDLFKDILPVVGKNVFGEDIRGFDIANNTISFRGRYALLYTEDEDNDFAEHLLFSDWSEEWSIGKDGTQPELSLPEEVSAPTVSNLSAPDEQGNISFDVEIPADIARTLEFYEIVDSAVEPMEFECTYSLDGGETWTPCDDIADPAWISSRRVTVTIEGLEPDADIQLRLRVLDKHGIDDLTSPWSAPVSYRTEAALGDADMNGTVNSADASLVLAEYAQLSTGGESLFSELQNTIADVNFDGTIDAGDASLILAYYAYLSTGGTIETMNEWLETVKNAE